MIQINKGEKTEVVYDNLRDTDGNIPSAEVRSEAVRQFYKDMSWFKRWKLNRAVKKLMKASNRPGMMVRHEIYANGAFRVGFSGKPISKPEEMAEQLRAIAEMMTAPTKPLKFNDSRKSEEF